MSSKRKSSPTSEVNDLEKYAENMVEAYEHYKSAIPRARSSSRFAWEMVRDNSGIWGRLRYIRKSQLARKVVLKLGGNIAPHSSALLSDRIEETFRARCLFDDDFSKKCFDEAVLTRAVGYKKYYPIQTSGKDVLFCTKESKFEHPNLPTTYSRASLKDFEVRLSADDSEQFRIVAPNRFVLMVNNWNQYLLQRDGIRVMPEVGDTVIDCGACIGDTSVLFSILVGQQGQVHAFDPIDLHADFCEFQASRNIENMRAIYVNRYAVSDESIELPKGKVSISKHIEPGGMAQGSFNQTTLDKYCIDKNLRKVDFIKMDIEGYESRALSGASATIRKYKPKLAISCYHSSEQLLNIGRQIKQIDCSYKLAFAHHSPLEWESVVYAY